MSGLDLHVDLAPGTGRRAALEQALRAAVREGRLAPHTRLPSTRELAVELELSRGTISAAYDQLIAEGYLVARHGSGTVVAQLPLPAAAAAARDAGGSTRTPATLADPADPAQALAEEVVTQPRFDLRPGRPDVSSFPVGAWVSATRKALARAPMAAYGYGDPRGRIELRTALADYLGRTRGVVAPPERSVITSGAGQALALLADVVRDAGGAVFAMEDPGLTFHREVIRRRGLGVVPLPVDEEGARTATLLSGRLPASAVVLTPAHQYPTGVVLNPERRRLVVDWASRGGGIVVEDDYDGEFRYDRQSVGALQGTAPEQVVYLGTASKTLAPGLRLAWLVLPARLVEPIVEAKRCMDLQTGSISQLTLAELVTGHAYDRHVRMCRQRYRRRRNLLMDRLAPALEAGYVVHGIAAGLHGLVDLPRHGPTEEEVLTETAAHGLALGQMTTHWFDPVGRPQGLVIGFGTPGESSYPAALDTLIRSLRTLHRRPPAELG